MPGAHSNTKQHNLTNFTLNHGPGSMDSAKRNVSREPGCSTTVSGSCNVGVENVAGCSYAVQDLPPFNMDAVNITAHELRKRSLRASSSGTRNEHNGAWMDGSMDGWMDGRKHGARAATAGPCCSCQQGSPRKLLDDPGAHGNEQGWQSKIEWGLVNVGSRHGMAKVAGKQSRQNKAAAGKHSRQMIRPAQALKKPQLQTIRPVQALQQNNSQQLAGLSPCSAGWWRECGGAGHSESGLGPTYLLPSHLSPLPVSVHTHSLNL